VQPTLLGSTAPTPRYGARSFNGTRTNKITATKEEYAKDRYEKYRTKDFGVFKAAAEVVVVPPTIDPT